MGEDGGGKALKFCSGMIMIPGIFFEIETGKKTWKMDESHFLVNIFYY